MWVAEGMGTTTYGWKKVKGAGQGAKTPKIKIQPNDMLGG